MGGAHYLPGVQILDKRGSTVYGSYIDGMVLLLYSAATITCEAQLLWLSPNSAFSSQTRLKVSDRSSRVKMPEAQCVSDKDVPAKVSSVDDNDNSIANSQLENEPDSKPLSMCSNKTQISSDGSVTEQTSTVTEYSCLTPTTGTTDFCSSERCTQHFDACLKSAMDTIEMYLADKRSVQMKRQLSPGILQVLNDLCSDTEKELFGEKFNILLANESKNLCLLYQFLGEIFRG